ncbi:hypothetical protein P12x_003053 [Tundrisphaera lichenicola]|uniref:hypothetical protein n=1 Tax=Tundrisphaera lichenicola TaxID=2029860 RepID=UPI003EBD25BF
MPAIRRLRPFGLLPFPPFSAGSGGVTLPLSLADAIHDRLAGAADLAGVSRFYESQAGDRASLPYVVYQVTAGTSLRVSSTSIWLDQRVIVKTYAATQESANDYRERIHAALKVGPYQFQAGVSIPLFQVNQSEGKEPARSRDSQLVFRAALEYSARTKKG